MEAMLFTGRKGMCEKGKKNANATDVSLNFDSCKESLDFCKENGIKMRGHTLVWHNQTPGVVL